MKGFTRSSILGAALLCVMLIGYTVYELMLWPAAGFPSDNMPTILAGANTLRMGHWLKFGYAIGIALLAVGIYGHLRDVSPTLAQFVLFSGIASAVLYLASGMIGLRILEAAESFYPANAADARSTVLVRVVTQALFNAATFAAGWFALLISLAAWRSHSLPRSLNVLGVTAGTLLAAAFILPDPIWMLGPLLAITWTLWLALALWREGLHRTQPTIQNA